MKVGGLFRTLRGRLLVLTTGLVCLVVLAVSAYLFSRQSEQLAQMRDGSRRQMRAALESKGLAVARNVARASERALATMDFLFVNEVIQTTVANDEAITYGIVMDDQRRALAHTDPSRLRAVLDDPLALYAASQSKDTVHGYDASGKPMLEAIAPLKVGDKQWNVRFGLSLDGVNAEIARAEAAAAAQARQNALVLAAVTALLAALAIAAGSFAASRIVRPLDELRQGVNALRQGELGKRVEISGGMDELTDLARGFNDMAAAVRARDEQLREKVAEVERALAQAEQAIRVKSEFLANISHELRTPLNAIVNVPSALLREYETFRVWACTECKAAFRADTSMHEVGDKSQDVCPDCNGEVYLREQVHCLGSPAEHTHFLNRLRQSGRHLLNVVNDLLDFSKLEAGKMNLFIDELQVGQAFADLEELIASVAADAGVRLLIAHQEHPLLFRGDRVKLNQILLNLVGNAIKFTPRGGQVSVRAHVEHPGQLMVFEVSDTGIGIPADKLGLIFESFRQVDGSHTRAHGGTGLGLAITKQLIELHGGAISVESTEGKGSTFRFRLPIDGRHADNDNEGVLASNPNRRRNQRVVVLDDDRVHLELTRLVLERAGYEVELLSSPEGAVADMRERPPNLVVLDIMLPGTSGLSMLRNLKSHELTRHIPVIVASAFPSNAEIVQKLGGIWVPKPWDADHFLHVLSTAVAVSVRPPVALLSNLPAARS